MTENTEIVEASAAEVSAAELEELRAKVREMEARDIAVANVAPELSTRDRSPVKPQDHMPAVGEKVTIEFGGVTFTAARGAFNKLRTLDLMERGMVNTAIRRVVGDEPYDKFLDANPEADDKTVGELLKALTEATGAGN